jgi:hypothetical protein
MVSNKAFKYMYLTLSKSEIKNLAMEITAKTYENDVDVNIGNKYFLTTMQSSDDLEVKKWVQEVKKIYGKHNRQGVAAGLNACRSIGFASCRYYKQEGSIYTQFFLQFHVFFQSY